MTAIKFQSSWVAMPRRHVASRPVPHGFWSPQFLYRASAAFLSVLLIASPAFAQRTALLIGNSGYNVSPLTSPSNDVREMATALRKVGFDVRTVLDADRVQFDDAVRQFASSTRGIDVAFFYYSGHGVQVGDENYLIPVRAAIANESDILREGVSASGVVSQVYRSKPRVVIVVLDACRNNNFAPVTLTGAKGLRRMEAPPQSPAFTMKMPHRAASTADSAAGGPSIGGVIAFATEPMTEADDASYFSRELSKQITTPGVGLVEVFSNTIAEVDRVTQGRQKPRITDWSLTTNIYLAGMPSAKTSAAGVPIQKAEKCVKFNGQVFCD